MSVFDDFNPEHGGNREGTRVPASARKSTYADIDVLKRDIDTLIERTTALQNTLVEELQGTALAVGDFDPRLVESLEREWPQELGEVPDFVSYRFYRSLQFRDTTASKYLRSRFEEAARDVSGTSALDLHDLASITKQEAELVRNFLDTKVSQTNDSSEHRILEVFQDWVQPALVQTKKLQAYAETGPGSAVTEQEYSAITSAEARRGQALSKVKLNASNDQVVRDMSVLKKNFSEFAEVFYERFLGPALQYRSEVSSQFPESSSKIAKELTFTSALMDENLKTVISDQSRRRKIYHNKTNKIFENVQVRDYHRKRIHELASKGKPVPQAGPRILIQAFETPSEVEFFDVVYPEKVNPSEPTVTSNHGALEGLETGNDHPQYLLRTGGTMSGDIAFADSATIDGVHPSTHAHTGEDGSAKISGSSILGGTLSEETIDKTQKPATPDNLQILELKEVIVPPGLTTFTATLRWDGSSDAADFQVQITEV